MLELVANDFLLLFVQQRLHVLRVSPERLAELFVLVVQLVIGARFLLKRLGERLSIAVTKLLTSLPVLERHGIELLMQPRVLCAQTLLGAHLFVRLFQQCCSPLVGSLNP
eukprot:Amastigsp_a511333_79.p3 type:complete len:110 gc:universal Amastigsp_a511333_79:496-825(+)